MTESIPADFPPGKDLLTPQEQRFLERIHARLNASPQALIFCSLPLALFHVFLIGLWLWIAHYASSVHAELGAPVHGVFTPIPGALGKFIMCIILLGFASR